MLTATADHAATACNSIAQESTSSEQCKDRLPTVKIQHNLPTSASVPAAGVGPGLLARRSNAGLQRLEGPKQLHAVLQAEPHLGEALNPCECYAFDLSAAKLLSQESAGGEDAAYASVLRNH